MTEEELIAELSERTGLRPDEATRIFRGLKLLGQRGSDTLLCSTITTIMIRREIRPTLSDLEEAEIASYLGSPRR